MDKRIWVPAFAVIAICIIALGAVVFGGAGAPAAASRPAADAPVDVVRAPASAVPPREPACRTCALGAGKGWL